MLNKKELTEVLGLSCVEKYFLAWMKKKYDVKKLYGNSFVGISQVFDDFSHGATYENYCYIPRLQDIAEDYGIVRHYYRSCVTEDAIKEIRAQGEDSLCLIRVNTRFFLNFKRASWREDHYICVGKDLNWVNEYPLTEGKFNETEFNRVYDGGLVVYKIEDLENEVPDECTEAIGRQDFGKLPSISLKSFESAIGVLRMTRKRLAMYYCGNAEVVKILKEEISILDKLYLNTRLKQLQEVKGIKTHCTVGEADMDKIIKCEKSLKEAIKWTEKR